MKREMKNMGWASFGDVTAKRYKTKSIKHQAIRHKPCETGTDITDTANSSFMQTSGNLLRTPVPRNLDAVDLLYTMRTTRESLPQTLMSWEPTLRIADAADLRFLVQ